MTDNLRGELLFNGLENPLDDNDDQEADIVGPAIGVDRKIPLSMWWIYFILGAAVLLPWNAIITATPYFLSRLAGSSVQSVFSSYLSTTFTVANFCFLAHATVTTKKRNSSEVIRLSLWAITFLNLLLTLSTFASFSALYFFMFVIFNGICQAVAGSYLQSAVVAVASLFGPVAIQAVMFGQAAVGVFVSLIQVLSSIAGVKNDTTLMHKDKDATTRAAFLFFAISTSFLLLTLILHSWLIALPDYKVVVVPFEAKGIISRGEECRGLVSGITRLNHGEGRQRIIDVARRNVLYNFGVAYVFAITLAVFPAITSSIRSVHFPPTTLFTRPLLFTALHFLFFNIGDIIGRYLPALRLFQVWSSRSLLIMSLARTLFIPAFLACNLTRPGSPASTPQDVIINSDLLFFFLLLLFGATNGYLGSSVMMAAPSPEHNPHLQGRPEDVDIAARIAQFCLVGGLAVGSFMSFGVRGLLCGCNPFVQ